MKEVLSEQGRETEPEAHSSLLIPSSKPSSPPAADLNRDYSTKPRRDDQGAFCKRRHTRRP